jgi:YHS domain-containing protein
VISLNDAVCGKQIVLEDATVLHRVEWQGEWFFLCSSKCVDRFRAAPRDYVRSLAVAASPLQAERRRAVERV